MVGLDGDESGGIIRKRSPKQIQVIPEIQSTNSQTISSTGSLNAGELFWGKLEREGMHAKRP